MLEHCMDAETRRDLEAQIKAALGTYDALWEGAFYTDADERGDFGCAEFEVVALLVAGIRLPPEVHSVQVTFEGDEPAVEHIVDIAFPWAPVRSSA